MRIGDVDVDFKGIASISGLSVRTVRALVASGKLGCVRHNAKVVMVPLEEWRRYREAKRVHGDPRPMISPEMVDAVARRIIEIQKAESAKRKKNGGRAAIRRHSSPSNVAPRAHAA